MNIVQEMQAVADQLGTILANIDCLVTLDPASAGRAVAAGQAVVVVFAPSVEYTTPYQNDLSWEVLVASGPSTDRVEAWESISAILDALEANQDFFNLTSSEPAAFAPATQEFAAYLIRFTS